MEGYEKCLREKRSHHHACKNPSFSSTLLDAIYRSIDHEQGLDHHHHDHDQRFSAYDEEEEQQQQQLFFYQQTTRKKQSSRDHDHDHHSHSCMQSCRIDQWLEKKSAAEKPTTLRWSDFQDGFPKPTKDHAPTFFNSTSTSSDSSCGGGFSSSETESIYGRRHSSAYSRHHPNPTPTTTHNKTQQIPKVYIPPPSYTVTNEQQKKTSKQDGFIKTKSRTASKIYNELKKARQPISPGGRLASFLNSIFAAGHAKKAKILSSSSSSIDGPHDLGYDRKSKSAQASTCSSASSFSRSCLSKTPSSRGGKPINGGGAKRSVRFLIVDEDGRPCGGGGGGGGDDLKIRLVEKNKRVEEAAKEMLKEFQLKKRERLEEVIRAVHHSHEDVDDDEDDEDDDDAGSCSSSDLFELENLKAIGMERYREELPVYETTHLGTNRAIANGLIL